MAAAVGGIPVVVPERNGLVVTSDDPDQLAVALLRLLRDRELAEQLGRAAHEDARRLQWTPECYAEATSR